MTTTFQQLGVWQDNEMISRLQWYYDVSINKRPAKFLIAKRIPVEFNEDMDKEQLWEVHAQATKAFLQAFEKIKAYEADLDDYEIQEQSLMELNVTLVDRMLESCNFCRWNCEVDRKEAEMDEDAKTGTCQLGEESRVGSYFHHRGEELIYRGNKGSGTIFFTSCNMRCQFCQNANISKDKYRGQPTTPKELAAMMWLLRMEGCHNINFVGGDPTIHLHTIIRAISEVSLEEPPLDTIRKVKKAKSDYFLSFATDKSNGTYKGEFNAPMLWNDNFFMSEPTMRILRTVIDIWLPDFKFGTNKKCATGLSRTPWYWETITRNLKMIHDWGEEFTIRHLIMPNHVDCCTIPILDWVKENMPKVPINVMDQYRPDAYTDPTSPKYKERYEEISRKPTRQEISRAIKAADELNLNYKEVTYN